MTEKLAADSGITPKAVRERHKTALRLAASEGVILDGLNGVEALDGETLEKVTDAASAAIAKQPTRKPKAETPKRPISVKLELVFSTLTDDKIDWSELTKDSEAHLCRSLLHKIIQRATELLNNELLNEPYRQARQEGQRGDSPTGHVADDATAENGLSEAEKKAILARWEDGNPARAKSRGQTARAALPLPAKPSASGCRLNP